MTHGTPHPGEDNRRNAWAEIAVFVLAALLALHLVGLRAELSVVHAPASVSHLMEYTATTPFQYRVLIPTLLQWIYRFSPLSPEKLPPQDLALIFDGLCVLGIWAGVRALLAALCLQGRLASSFGALIVFFMLPFNYLISSFPLYAYVWDLPAVLVFTLGLLLLYRRRFLLYYALFVLGTFNRETTIFLTLVQLFTGWSMKPRRALVAHVAVQAALWVAIRYFLIRAFADNPGPGPMPNLLVTNLWVLMTPASLLVTMSSFGFLWLPVLLFQHRIREPFLRRAVWVIVPFFLGGMYVGSVTELRIWGEMTPIVALGFFGIVRGLLEPGSQAAAHSAAPDPR